METFLFCYALFDLISCLFIYLFIYFCNHSCCCCFFCCCFFGFVVVVVVVGGGGGVVCPSC